MRAPDENLKEDGLKDLLADEEGRNMEHNSLKKQVTPAEFNMKKTDEKLRETQTEIKKVQDKIQQL